MIFVTGATGIVGSRLLHELLEKGESVRALHRENSSMRNVYRYIPASSPLYRNIEWVSGDITDQGRMEELLEGVDQLYHCASVVSFRKDDRARIRRSNIRGTESIVNACLHKGDVRMCHVSSTAALGRAQQGEWISEGSTWRNSSYNSYYAISKFKAEREVWRGIAEGLEAVIINPSIIVGPGNWTNDSSMPFTRVWNGLSFYTDGLTGFVGVEDVVRSMIMLMGSGISGERFIISSENVGFREFFSMIADSLGKKRPWIHAGKNITSIAWRAEYIRSLLTGTAPSVTREHMVAANKRSYYSNEKILEKLGVDFRPVSEVISETAEIFKREH
jgi:nucleoside-diphosphate-sugar epimerase